MDSLTNQLDELQRKRDDLIEELDHIDTAIHSIQVRLWEKDMGVLVGQDVQVEDRSAHLVDLKFEGNVSVPVVRYYVNDGTLNEYRCDVPSKYKLTGVQGQ